jgi:hypothetical protein
MRRSTALLVATPALVAGLAGLAGTASAASATPKVDKPGWHLIYQLPFVNYDTVGVTSVAAISGSDAWAGGGELAKVNGVAVGIPEVLHWNGARWSFTGLPRPQHVGTLSAVTASSAGDVWAFGSYVTDPSPFIAHYNGHKWTWFTRGDIGRVYAVADLGPTDLWINGAVEDQVRNWNGRSWRVYHVPGQGVQGLAGVSPRDVWAIAINATDDQFEALHWNGRAWHLVPVPPVTLPQYGQSLPQAITAASGDSVWAVGALGYLNPQTKLRNSIPVAYHWNGRRWQELTVPASLYSHVADGAEFTAVTPDGAGGFYASMGVGVGQAGTAKLVHYLHGKWTAIALPVISGSAVFPLPPTIVSLTAVPGTDQTWIPIMWNNLRTGNYQYSIYRYVR